jgi:simple sugar transport system ATP-binding protein
VQAEFERPLDPGRIVEAMLGELVADLTHAPAAAGETVVRFEGARLFDDSPAFDLELHEREVLGVTGLVGAGKSELLGALFGTHRLRAGRVLLDGEEIRPREPAEAIGHGIHLVPEDRAAQALVPGWSVRENAVLALVRRLFNRVRDERRRTSGLIDDLGIATAGPEAPIESLSGGNQQKVVVGRWLLSPARVLLLDEPFRGVDLGARRDIAAEVRERAAEAAVVVASSDVDEVLEVADRVLVLAGGGVVRDVPAAKADRGELTLAMNGGRA